MQGFIKVAVYLLSCHSRQSSPEPESTVIVIINAQNFKCHARAKLRSQNMSTFVKFGGCFSSHLLMIGQTENKLNDTYFPPG